MRDIIEQEKLKCSGQSRFKLHILENHEGEVHLGEQPFDNCHDKMEADIDYRTGCAREMDNEKEPHLHTMYANDTDRTLLNQVMEMQEIVP